MKIEVVHTVKRGAKGERTVETLVRDPTTQALAGLVESLQVSGEVESFTMILSIGDGPAATATAVEEFGFPKGAK